MYVSINKREMREFNQIRSIVFNLPTVSGLIHITDLEPFTHASVTDPNDQTIDLNQIAASLGIKGQWRNKTGYGFIQAAHKSGAWALVITDHPGHD